ncbi:hypothetical protein NPIL_138461, partial [Nephila pilipes]
IQFDLFFSTEAYQVLGRSRCIHNKTESGTNQRIFLGTHFWDQKPAVDVSDTVARSGTLRGITSDDSRT